MKTSNNTIQHFLNFKLALAVGVFWLCAHVVVALTPEDEKRMDEYLKVHLADTITTQDVIHLLELKESSDDILKEIGYKASNDPTLKFSLSDADTSLLKKAGATDQLIEGMRSPTSAVRYLASSTAKVSAAASAAKTTETPTVASSPSATASSVASESASSSESPGEKTPEAEQSLVSVSAGAYVVKRPREWMDDESAFHMLDEKPRTVWASPRGDINEETIVIALPEKTLLKTLEFDNSHVDAQFTGCSAKDITVEMSDTSENDGFQKIADVSLKDREENQRFPVSAEVPGRWVRLTIKNNHNPSDQDNTIELSEFRAFGEQFTHTPLPNISGTYETYFTNSLHLKQEGMSVTGCYEAREGRLEGGIEGRTFKFTYYELNAGKNQEMGVGVMVFSPDGKQLFSLWQGGGRERLILGEKKTDNVGSCPGWKSEVEDQMTKEMEEFGRVRVYGVNFDSDKDVIKDESKPTLDKIVAMLKAKPDWKITIEGHTDSTSTPQHNQGLSERRAASVKNYLVTAGIDGSRLTTVGYGQTKPVASNDTPIGRAQNRRVELGKL